MRFIKPIDEISPFDFALKINNEVHIKIKMPVAQKSKFNLPNFLFYKLLKEIIAV